MRSDDSGPAIGVDIGGTKVLLLACWPDGRPPDSLRLDTGPDTTPDQLEHHIVEFAAALRPPAALGIAVPGLVEAGRVVDSDVMRGIEGWCPRHLLGDGVPEAVVNDLYAALIEETTYLDAKATAVVLLAGTGIGMAYMSEGHIVKGGSGWAGELGSIPMSTPSGIVCLNGLAGGASIVRRSGLTPDGLHRALAAGDGGVSEIIRQAGEALGLAIAIVIDMVNPEFLILGGGTITYEGYLTEALAVAAQTAQPRLWEACTVRRARHGPFVVALGAARCAQRQGGGAIPPDG